MTPIKFIKQVFGLFSQDKVGQLSAAFAYVATFSIGPLLLVIISVVGFIFGQKAVEGTLFNQLSGTVGPSTAKTLQTLVAHTHQSGDNLLALIVGSVGLLLGATALTIQLQNSFDAIFDTVPDPKGGIKRTIYVKVKNVILIILGGTAVVASLLASTLIIGLAKRSSLHSGLEVVNSLVSLAVFVLLLYLIYKVIPDVKLPNKVVLGASFSIAILFLIGKVVLGIIIGRNGTASAYGAAASLVTLLLWIFYSGQLLFLGAEGIKAYGLNHALIFDPKRFNLKRATVVLDSKGPGGRLIEAFMRGAKGINKS
jgi:membrane protein